MARRCRCSRSPRTSQLRRTRSGCSGDWVRSSVATAAFYPIPLVFFLGVFLRSAVGVILHRPVTWKGRSLSDRRRTADVTYVAAGLPVIQFGDLAAVAIDSVAWALIQSSAGYFVHRLPASGARSRHTGSRASAGGSGTAPSTSAWACGGGRTRSRKPARCSTGGVSKRHLAPTVDGLHAVRDRDQAGGDRPLDPARRVAALRAVEPSVARRADGRLRRRDQRAVHHRPALQPARVERALARRFSSSPVETACESAAARSRKRRSTTGSSMP